MIELHVSDYCQDCPEFQAQVDSHENYITQDGYVAIVRVDHIITCVKEEQCNNILNYLKNERE